MLIHFYAGPTMNEPIGKVLFDEAAIRERVAQLAQELTEEYHDTSLTIVAVMRGSVLFLADLVRLLSFPVRIELVGAESYGSSTVSSGQVRIVPLSDLTTCITDAHVLVLDDILDTGLTLSRVQEHIASFRPKSLRTCVFLDKPSRRTVVFEADFRGFVIEDHFVVGYGLDFDGRWRNLPYIAVLPSTST